MELLERLKLAVSNATEQRIFDYLRENASEVLVEKINAGSKTLAGAIDYAKEEARKLAAGASAVCVEDATVFGWIIHFFEEDHIEEPKKRSAQGAVCLPGGVKQKQNPKPAKKAPTAKAATGPIVLELFSAAEMGIRS